MTIDQPLRRQDLSRAARVMIPAYPIFIGGFGLTFLAWPVEAMLNTPVFRTANTVMPLRTWGALGVLVAIVMIATMLGRGTRFHFQLALGTLFVVMATWTVVCFVGLFADGATPLATLFGAFVCTACWASFRSLGHGEK